MHKSIKMLLPCGVHCTLLLWKDGQLTPLNQRKSMTTTLWTYYLPVPIVFYCLFIALL